MKLTKKKTIELHRELWDWLYHHPSKSKTDWPEWDRIEEIYGMIPHNCFPCAYAIKQRKHPICPSLSLAEFCSWPERCECCPLDWGEKSCSYPFGYFNSDYRGLFMTWDHLNPVRKNSKRRKELAAQIRDLPVRRIRRK